MEIRHYFTREKLLFLLQFSSCSSEKAEASICFYSISFLHWKSFSQLGDLIKQMPFLASPCCQNSFSHKSWTPNHSWEVLWDIFSFRGIISPIWERRLIYKFPTPVITAPSVFIHGALPAKITIISFSRTWTSTCHFISVNLNSQNLARLQSIKNKTFFSSPSWKL